MVLSGPWTTDGPYSVVFVLLVFWLDWFHEITLFRIAYRRSIGCLCSFRRPTTLTGTVTKVRDGDTIEVGKIPIRLNGVSAPEMNEPLGPQSKALMTDLVMGKPVRCELDGSKTHDRFVGICYLDEQDIGATVIGAGLALDCPSFSGRRYAEYEIEGAWLEKNCHNCVGGITWNKLPNNFHRE